MKSSGKVVNSMVRVRCPHAEMELVWANSTASSDGSYRCSKCGQMHSKAGREVE